MSDITRVLNAVTRGEKQASEDLLPLVYEELRRLAQIRMANEAAGQTLQPTALVHEAWLRLVGSASPASQSWESRSHFFGAAANAMRCILVENARRKSRIKRGGGQVRVEFEGLEVAEPTPDDKILMVDEALAKLERDDPEQAKVVVLKFFGGLTNQEVAEHMGISERTVHRHWVCARARLFRLVRKADG
jgi:RNA polymerase sigma factor (TIGR02999 family)